MTHPTATHAATAHRQVCMSGRISREHDEPNGANCPAIIREETVFYSPVANSLELSTAGFHYSVISGLARMTMAPGLVDCHLSIDEVAAVAFWPCAADSGALAGGQ